jgi:hypothetical protein
MIRTLKRNVLVGRPGAGDDIFNGTSLNSSLLGSVNRLLFFFNSLSNYFDYRFVERLDIKKHVILQLLCLSLLSSIGCLSVYYPEEMAERGKRILMADIN